jgi:Resolvase, N terminal domain/Helix-turn-helix domain of resolvase
MFKVSETFRTWVISSATHESQPSIRTPTSNTTPSRPPTATGCSPTRHPALDNRKELTKVLDQLRPGDTLVVWRLDRLGRSLRHLIETVTALAERKIRFRSLTESIDTTAGGKLVFHLFGPLAEFERDLIRDRTMAGLTAARARGRIGGRPPALTPDKLAIAQQMHASREHTMEAIAKVVGVSRATLYRHLLAEPPSPPPVTEVTQMNRYFAFTTGETWGRTRFPALVVVGEWWTAHLQRSADDSSVPVSRTRRTRAVNIH